MISLVLGASLLTASLLLNPGPETDCTKYPVFGPCTTVEWAAPQWFRLFAGAEGYNRGITKVGIRGKGQADPCTLREVTSVHYSYPQIAFKWTFRLGEFKRVLWQFDAKLDYYSGPPECGALPTAYVTADLSVWRPNGQWTLLGNLIYLGPDAWRPSQQPFWSDGVNRTLVMSPYSLRGGEWQHFEFDFLTLYQKYWLPPKGYRWEDAIVAQAELYVSVRGADLEYSSRNHDIVGVPHGR
jgi:hypothetical protein